jgi:hypothetical protein
MSSNIPMQWRTIKGVRVFSAIWDADGNFIELNRIMGAPAGSKAAQ